MGRHSCTCRGEPRRCLPAHHASACLPHHKHKGFEAGTGCAACLPVRPAVAGMLRRMRAPTAAQIPGPLVVAGKAAAFARHVVLPHLPPAGSVIRLLSLAVPLPV
jgi:hypothetical protein